ncbi:fructosamine kinase family protein [Nesterenkonia suensis]
MIFRKPSPTAHPQAAEIEAAGLRWLAEARLCGGVDVVEVHGVVDGVLQLETVAEARPDPAAAAAFGTSLARTHRSLPAGVSFGELPPAHPAGAPPLFGPAEQLLPLGAGAHASWGAFYAQERLDPLLERLGEVPAQLRAARDRIAAGDFDGASPGADRGEPARGAEPPSRLHGDLWAGNLLWRAAPADPAAAVEAVLIDPFAHAGHRETDLAMLQLFGMPHLETILRAYDAEAPLAPGWRDRVPVHQLFPLLGHWVLFGQGYARPTLEACERILPGRTDERTRRIRRRRLHD